MLEAVRNIALDGGAEHKDGVLSFSAPPVAQAPGAPRLFRIGAAVMVLIWDLPSRIWRAGRLERLEGAAFAPLASLRLQKEDGGTRLVWAFRAPEEPAHLSLLAGAVGPGAELVVDPDAEIAEIAPSALTEGLAGAARMSLLCALLDAWPSIFRLRRSRSYGRFLHTVVRGIVAAPGAARPLARLGGEILVAETAVQASFGDINAIHHVSGLGFERLARRPNLDAADRQGRRRVLLTLRETLAQPGQDGMLVLMSANGFAVRKLEEIAEIPSLSRWWRAQSVADPALRERMVALAAECGEAGACAALEFQLQCPLQPVRLVGREDAPETEINLALGTSAGVLVGGWMRDTLGLVEGLDHVDGDTRRPLDAALHSFPVTLERNGNRVSARGFLALGAATSAPLLQPRFAMRLRSGDRQALVPPPQPPDVYDMRSRALNAVPPQSVSPALLAKCLGPALAAIQARLIAQQAKPDVVEIGPRVAHPRLSIVVPIYKVVEFLRTQVAAFAADPALRDAAEIIYVLDSPEQAEGVEHLLRGLALLYGLSFVLVVMPRNAGFAIASNAGAREARGGVIVQMNSDVLPLAAGWLDVMAARLSDGVGMVGPKLLFPDGALQHAGMYFAPGLRGGWLNHHFHKGMPGAYPPASVERSVPAVTGACIVMPRALYEEVGGFTEDYVIGDYEDSDLCLKVRAKGRDIRYVPDAVLYHFERRSMRASPDHARGTASAYNAWLHADRWGAAMAELMRPCEEPGEGRAAA